MQRGFMQRKLITLLITGTVLTAGLLMGFGGYVFAGDPIEGLDITICQGVCPDGRVSDKIYDSSFSKTKSIGLVRKEVGDVLLRYGVGGADINKVTEALEGKGVYEAELKWFLLAIGINEKDAQDILAEFDTIGIGTTGGTPQSIVNQELHRPPTSATGQPGAGQIEKDASRGTGEQRFKDIQGLDSETRSGGFIKLGDLPGKRAAFGDSAQKSIQDLKAAESDDQLKGKVRHELQANRETLQKSAETLRQNLRENAQDLRDNFRTEYLKYELKDVRVVSFRIAIAHGKGLRMINRYRSAIARFDHILGRLESRIEKIGIEIEGETRAQGNVLKVNNPGKEMAIAFIEEAKNTQALNKAKLAELEAKYESLLLGENPGGIAKEAREIAKELKAEIEKLHGLLGDIRQAAGTINTTKSNTF